MWWTIPVVFVLILLMYRFLYLRGLAWWGTKKCFSFIGTSGGRKASFVACTGRLKRVLRFSQSGTYHFQLQSQLSKGSFELHLTGPDSQPLLCLDAAHPQASVKLKAGAAYRLVLIFQQASGKYTLSWTK